MNEKLTRKAKSSGKTSTNSRNGVSRKRQEIDVRELILRDVSEVRILDPDLSRDYIRDRQDQDIDQHDEVWEGVYIVPPLANNPHQNLVGGLSGVLFNVVTLEGRGQVLPGANVSGRRKGWHKKFRGPDVVVVLEGSAAIDWESHWQGGPDFLVEIQSPGDETEGKIPFYGQLRVRELLIVHRDSRHLRLYRHNGEKLVLVEPSILEGERWIVSKVVPLAFRRKAFRGGARIEVRRTDGVPGSWTI